MNKPPPLPPRRRQVSQTVTLAQLLDGERPPLESIPDDEPTKPDAATTRLELELDQLCQSFRAIDQQADRDYVLRLARQYAARGSKT